jgi:hypothetical protein
VRRQRFRAAITQAVMTREGLVRFAMINAQALYFPHFSFLFCLDRIRKESEQSGLEYVVVSSRFILKTSANGTQITHEDSPAHTLYPFQYT